MESDIIKINSTKELFNIIESKFNVDDIILDKIKKEDKEIKFNIFGEECILKFESVNLGSFSKPYFSFIVYHKNEMINVAENFYIPDNEEIENFKKEYDKFINPLKYYGYLQHNVIVQKPTLTNKYPIKFKDDFVLEVFFILKCLKKYKIQKSFSGFVTDILKNEGKNLYSLLNETIKNNSEGLSKTQGGALKELLKDVKNLKKIKRKYIKIK